MQQIDENEATRASSHRISAVHWFRLRSRKNRSALEGSCGKEAIFFFYQLEIADNIRVVQGKGARPFRN